MSYTYRYYMYDSKWSTISYTLLVLIQLIFYLLDNSLPCYNLGEGRKKMICILLLHHKVPCIHQVTAFPTLRHRFLHQRQLFHKYLRNCMHLGCKIPKVSKASAYFFNFIKSITGVVYETTGLTYVFWIYTHIRLVVHMMFDPTGQIFD